MFYKRGVMVQWGYLSCIILPKAPRVISSKPGPFYSLSFLTLVVTAMSSIADARKTAGGRHLNEGGSGGRKGGSSVSKVECMSQYSYYKPLEALESQDL